MDERHEYSEPVPNEPAAAQPVTPPHVWHEKKRFLCNHKRLLTGLAIGFLVGLFMGGTMSMVAVRRVSAIGIMSRSSMPAMPAMPRYNEQYLIPSERYFSERREYLPGYGHGDSDFGNSDDSYLQGYKDGYKDGYRER